MYLHDCIVESRTQKMDKPFAMIAEKLTFHLSSKVYSLSDPMARFYSGFGYMTEILPHGVDASLMRIPRNESCRVPARIGFAGAVYETNGSAIQELVAAKAFLDDGVEIHFATTPMSMHYMRKLGVLDGLDHVVTLGTHSEVLDFLSSCDILFLPMSFESPFEKDLLTIFPTKVTDYWLAQRPILVYGPRKYAFVTLAKECGYAKVVSERGPEDIANAITELCNAPEQRERLVEASRRMIPVHDSARIADRLKTDLGIVRSRVMQLSFDG